MITVGIDSGIRTTKAAVLVDGALAATACVPTDWEPAGAGAAALETALADASVARDAVVRVAATGVTRDAVAADCSLTGINAAALGARWALPGAGEVIDLGAEGIRAVRIDEAGDVGNYAVNDRCASGAGAFLETMARILDVPVDQLGALDALRKNDVNIDTQCVVFAESEVISLIHSQVPAPDIVHAVHRGLANKIGSIVLRVNVADPVVMIGASAADAGLVGALEAKLGHDITVPANCEFISAVGAAVFAANEAGEAIA